MKPNDTPTPKFTAFKAELEDLCRRHRVMLGSSLYDSPAVFDIGEDQKPIWCDDLQDFTKEAPLTNQPRIL